MTIPIVIVEAHPGLRAALRALLEREFDFEVVGEAASASEMLSVAKELRPRVILLDSALPDLQIFPAICRLHRVLPEVAVLLLIDWENRHLEQGALRAGAAGCVVTRAAGATLASVVRALAQDDV
jgi:two-component system, NarL family, nitrate/nitrite response regulator NarL